MSGIVKFRMHDGHGGIVGLADVLAVIPENDWVWSILDFDGVGRFPDGLDYHDFRDKVLATREGYVMSWPQLQGFAAGIRQFFDLLAVAVKERDDLAPDRFAVDDFGGCLITLAAIDSGSWEVAVGGDIDAGSRLTEELRARFGGELR
ncbi:hypothetical protein ABDE16_24415 [Streptomyces sp. BRB040]|uniref:hypothetical protein n=1 Tax=Streptomyces sp. BRB040 TaxID=3142634 RepID=UPI0031F6095A